MAVASCCEFQLHIRGDAQSIAPQEFDDFLTYNFSDRPQKPGFYEFLRRVTINIRRNPVSRSCAQFQKPGFYEFWRRVTRNIRRNPVSSPCV
ncbi:MAG: hypothetical protein JGK17_24675 [Microcoleus sp. PH2017_10_PVI_O_A]|uniref:hypothetical protein n=1 Tax=unclassified Microcoleus TaxID=2642155 RepID=UPI001DAFE525|nr:MULTISPECIES: hypothetical protein [unclassified Microcoleus]MCC3408711.1 hypothetical protein [Microcoleus sp. PH2017_10_PVI_O_A]MCC3462798.1 hypothetical protein [Microcoleus sp. PH2017_11_PCY_U_A]MCC3481249.1 hypothetical protein [Microcoleus sp. PH2017_12_PCY_D_A]MCC3531278.1 hypothetical protein [Microcoleus sp. PH2017_21_RUC_O_A]MCC3543614.1 hypothetical protein [Microcoleus sp. PH2017_22_RUC_O_B]